MFTVYHLIWLFISAAVLAAGLGYVLKKRPRLRSVLTALCLVCVASELMKVFSSIEMVPSADGSTCYPYLELGHVPLHLCSMQVVFIFYVRFTKNTGRRTALLAFMYPTCLAGALLALLMPSIFGGSVDAQEAFGRALPYQYFLYHCALIVLGAYIPLCGEVDIRPRHWLSTMGMLAVFAFASIYFNSIFADATYENGALVSVDYVTNFLFTYEPPFDLGITEKWHWMLFCGGAVHTRLPPCPEGGQDTRHIMQSPLHWERAFSSGRGRSGEDLFKLGEEIFIHPAMPLDAGVDAVGGEEAVKHATVEERAAHVQHRHAAAGGHLHDGQVVHLVPVLDAVRRAEETHQGLWVGAFGKPLEVAAAEYRDQV